MTHATTAALTCGLTLAAATLLGACSSPEDQAAADAATGFQQALATPTQACTRLAPETLKKLEKDGPCAKSLPALRLPSGNAQVQDVKVAGHTARVRMDSDLIFLALFDDGWKVLAAGCQSGEDMDTPAECELED